MEVNKAVFPGLTNGTRMYSPVTLSKEWSTLGRLATMVFASCFGAVMNGYFVASFMSNHDLYNIRNVFHCCLGLADMMITSLVIPIATIVLLSGVWDIHPVCQSLQALTAASTYSYSMLFAMVAVENYYRVCHLKPVSNKLIRNVMRYSACIVFPCSLALAIYGTFWHLDYDYCDRRFYGDLLFRHATSILIHGTCFIVTMTGLIKSYRKIQREKMLPSVYRRIRHFTGDLPNLVRLNIFSYILYVASWTPYLIVVNFYPNISDRVYYQCAWLGIGRTLITSLVYGSLAKLFSSAYSNIFYYCCCKMSFHGFDPYRSNRVPESGKAERAQIAPEVRTHIMQQAVNLNSPQRASSSVRETLEL